MKHIKVGCLVDFAVRVMTFLILVSCSNSPQYREELQKDSVTTIKTDSNIPNDKNDMMMNLELLGMSISSVKEPDTVLVINSRKFQRYIDRNAEKIEKISFVYSSDAVDTSPLIINKKKKPIIKVGLPQKVQDDLSTTIPYLERELGKADKCEYHNNLPQKAEWNTKKGSVRIFSFVSDYFRHDTVSYAIIIQLQR
jgi:hypothetical protein